MKETSLFQNFSIDEKRKHNFKAFSFVEVIVVISMIILLVVIGAVIVSNKKGNTDNGKVVADISEINTAITAAKQEQVEIILPLGNTNNFSRSGTYVHDFNSLDTFGVYGNFVESNLTKKFLNIIPLDPRTNQYYSYGVAKESREFEVSGVVEDEKLFKAKVVGDYRALDNISSLIREYNGPNYVIDNSENLPYNPKDKVLLATDKNGNVYREGDIIKNTTNNDLEVFFSDGSASIITMGTTLELTELSFLKENNSITQIKIFLQSGAIWVQAAQLGEGSSFQIQTADVTSSVRGTVFGVIKGDDLDFTQVVVIEGIVDVTSNNTNNTIEVVGGQIADGTEKDVTLRDSNEVPYPFFTLDNLINNVILDDLDVEDLIVQKRKECEEIGGKFDEYFLECMMEEEEIVE